MSVTLRSAGTLSLEALASLFEASFEGYLVPLRQTPRQLATRVRSEQVDLAQSLIAVREDVPCGICLLARRGDTVRVAAMGVTSGARGAGVGRLLMDAALATAREHGAGRLLLEVFEKNETARRLYERSGLRVRRRLTGWVREPRPATATQSLRRVHTLELARAMAAEPTRDWPWQLAPETVASGSESMPVHALGEDALAWVDDSAQDKVVLRLLHVRPEARRRGVGRRMVEALQSRYPGRALVVPPIAPEAFVGEVLPSLGFQRTGLDQLEMERELP